MHLCAHGHCICSVALSIGSSIPVTMYFLVQMKQPVEYQARLSHCKKRWVVLTTEWLPWMQETMVYFGIRG